MQHEPVVLAERLPATRSLEHGAPLERQLERVVERGVASGVALCDDAAALVEQREGAAEVTADDREQRLDAAAFEHRVGESLVHLERPGQPLQLLVGEPGARGLRDRHERDLVRDADDRKAELVRLVDERGRHLGEAESEPEPEAGEPVLREPPQVRALGRRELADPEAGCEQELAALEELRRVVELRHVEPCHRVVEAVRARGHRQAEPLELDDVADGQHSDTRAKTRPVHR